VGGRLSPDAIPAAAGIIGLLILGWSALSLPPARPDTVDQLMTAFRAAGPHLPARGTVGYVGPSAPTVSDGEIRYIAQYALAPRLLVDDLANQAVAIAPPALDARRSAEIIAQGWTAGPALDGGVRVYRR
jgi:hypothetical protein